MMFSTSERAPTRRPTGGGRSYADAKQITQALGGKWHGSYGTAPCPICQPEGRRDQNGLTLRNGQDDRLLLHCKKAGPTGGCDFVSLISALGLRGTPVTYAGLEESALGRREADRAVEERRKRQRARTLWAEAVPVVGTITERYLRARFITGAIPDTIRHHASALCGEARNTLPAMVAKVERAGRVVGVHRTFLAAPGRKADVEGQKLALGPIGGGAVRLQDGAGALVVAEGIETTLSLRDLLQEPTFSFWAALSTSGMTKFELPSGPGELVIGPDGDAPGRKAADQLADRATHTGWRVRVLQIPDGMDWNDIAREGGRHE